MVRFSNLFSNILVYAVVYHFKLYCLFTSKCTLLIKCYCAMILYYKLSIYMYIYIFFINTGKSFNAKIPEGLTFLFINIFYMNENPKCCDPNSTKAGPVGTKIVLHIEHYKTFTGRQPTALWAPGGPRYIYKTQI